MPKTAPKRMDTKQRYAWTGAAIGLYFAIFAKPSGVPDIPIAIALSVLAAIVTTIIRSWKKKHPFAQIVKDFLGMFFLYSAFLVSMQLRKYANDIGGRVLVGIVTVIIGILIGLFFAAQEKAAAKK